MHHDLKHFVDSILAVEITEDELMHVYDPVKAKLYYERTKKLKGRKAAVVKPKAAPKTTSTKAKAKAASAAKAKAAKRAKLKAAAEKRVFELKIRLKKLEQALEALSKQAKTQSGSDSKAKSQSASEKAAADKKRKPLTAAQKRDAAKKAAERREEEGDQSLSSQEKSLEAKIAKVRERIEDMKVEIEVAKRRTNAR